MNPTVRQVDWLLYNRRWLREVVASVGDSSRSIILLGPGGGMPDPTAVAGIRRETLSSVLDAVDGALGHLRAGTRRVIRLKYEQELSHKELADRLNLSVRTVNRRVAAGRSMVARFLAAVGDRQMAQFWHVFGLIVA